MANSDASSSTTCTVRVLVSFYLAATHDSSIARTLPIHKEKFNVPLSGDEHKHAAGTLPLNMYGKELPVGDRVTEEASSADDIGDQLSEYDSDSSNEEDSATHQEDAVEAVPVNFLSKTVRTRTGRQITLSYRALSSYLSLIHI